MREIKQPIKKDMRQYIAQRDTAQMTAPSLQEIRRQLGWELLERLSSECKYSTEKLK